LNAFAGSPFNVGLALAFLFLKNYELRDLFSLINAKANSVPAERVLDSLILRKS
jgi:vacuolar-type H+-ATPase subunit C/Vma6